MIPSSTCQSRQNDRSGPTRRSPKAVASYTTPRDTIRRDPPTLFDLIEEPFDQVASSVEIWAEADRLVAIASRRYIGPSAPLCDECSDPIGVIASVREQHSSTFQPRQKTTCKSIIVRLTGCHREPHRKPI